MSGFSRFVTAGLGVAIAISFSGCGDNRPPSPTALSPSPTISLSPASPIPTGSPTASPTGSPTSGSPTPQPTDSSAVSPSPSPTAAAGMETVTLYKADNQCSSYLPETTQVPADQPLAATVGKVIDAQDNADFQLTGYRVNLAEGVATIDFRVAPNSPRQIVSLSSCEQFALFGSLTETLTKNPDWQVQEVRFTERGEAIEF